MTRRGFLKFIGGGVLAALGLGTYAFGVEPLLRFRTSYKLQLPNWPRELELKIAVLADFHACNPWMSLGRIRRIVEATNAMEPDLILLLGDYVAGTTLVTSQITSPQWAKTLSGLNAPLGVFAVLGNHDWWDDFGAQKRGHGPTIAGTALSDAGIKVLENQAVRVEKDGEPFWIAGLGDQLAFTRRSRYRAWKGVDDLPGTIAGVTDDAPVILMAHEPDIFPKVPQRVALTLSGHTHGGQVNLFGWTPMVPSRYGSRYAHGHIVEEGRHLIVSAGLGVSILPVRFMRPPEIVIVELGGPA
jgi:predicted MPP superfamily phosphohydrolase